MIARLGSAGVNNKPIGMAINLEAKLFQLSILWSFIYDRPIHHIVASDYFPCSIITSQN